MKISIILYSVMIIASVSFLSCNIMKKNLMEDIADDIKEVVISRSGDEYFVVAKEEIFQATSKSDNGGIRHITGYDEYRISSYDLNTGRLSARVALGDREDNTCSFLGETGGKLWYKSVDKNLGFHAREPKNLSVVISQDKITEVNPFLKDNLSQPDWNSISTYYGFDEEKNMPMVSDNSGFVYYINPETLIAEKTSESIERIISDNNCLSTSMYIDADNSIYLDGAPRCYVKAFNKENKDISFLKGQFLQSSNVIKPSESDIKFFAPYLNEIAEYKRGIDSIRKLIDEQTMDNGQSYSNNKKRAERNILDLQNKIKYAEEKIKRNSRNENFSLVSEDNGVFILSQTDVTDQAKIIISKVKINSDSTISLAWQTEVSDIFRDPVKGMDRSSFEVVFSKGNPDLGTMRVLSGNRKLVIFSMLHAFCIDEENGRILWNRELK